jgi:hypothetical protein
MLLRDSPPSGFQMLLVGWIDQVGFGDRRGRRRGPLEWVVFGSGRIITEPGADDPPVDVEGARLAAGLLTAGIDLHGGLELDNMTSEDWWFDADGNRLDDVDDTDPDLARQVGEGMIRPVMAVTDWRIIRFVLYEPGAAEPAFPGAHISASHPQGVTAGRV